MSRETKRRHYCYLDPETVHLTGPDATKRTKIQHTTISPELSLAKLSIHETVPPESLTATATATNNYAGINRYLRQIHIERFGDPELRERWWDRYDESDKNQSDNQDKDAILMDLTDE